jgi:hypothetical protein
VDERFEGRDYALIAGCRADEVSYEYSDPATKLACGALTYFFVREIRNAVAGEVTYRDIMDKVRALVAKEYPTQHPQLEGARLDHFVFHDGSNVPQPFILAAQRNDHVELEAGAVQGVTVGSVFDVYSPNTKKFVGVPAIAQIEVTAVEPFSASAKRLQGEPISAASRAVVRRHNYQEHKLGVFLSRRNDSKVLEQIREALQSPDRRVDTANENSPKFRDLFEIVAEAGMGRLILDEFGPNESPDVPNDGRRYIVLSAGDGSSLSPPLPAADAKVVESALNQLAQWGKWFNLLDIENPNPTQLKVTFQVRSVAAASGGKVTPSADGGLVLKPDELIEISVVNVGDQPIFFAILDLSTDGGVGVVYPPPGDQQSLAAGQPWARKTKTTLDKDRRMVRDFLKLFVTTRPVDFSFLRQDKIKGMPRDPQSRANPLVRLLGEAAFIEKGVAAVQADVDEWVTVTRVLDVVRGSNE